MHHCANEVTEAGPRGAKRQAILVGMGVHPGFADLVVLCDGRVLFLELKSLKGRLSPAQKEFRDAVLAQGFGWALVRSLDDALGALHGGGAGHDGQGLLVGDSLCLHDLPGLMPLFRTEGHGAPPSSRCSGAGHA